MHAFVNVLGFVGALLVLGLAAFGVLAVAAIGSEDGERRRMRDQARAAELRIAEVGRQAQVAILGEALRRASASRIRADRPAEDWPDR